MSLPEVSKFELLYTHASLTPHVCPHCRHLRLWEWQSETLERLPLQRLQINAELLAFGSASHPRRCGPRDGALPVWPRFFTTRWGPVLDLAPFFRSIEPLPYLFRVFSRRRCRE